MYPISNHPDRGKGVNFPTWERVYRENIAWIRQMVRRLGAGQIDVEDAIQDIFLIVGRKLSEFEGRSKIQTWLFRICINVVVIHRRRKSRDFKLKRAFEEQEKRTKILDVEEARKQVKLDFMISTQMLEKLNAKKRQVFLLSEMEGLSGAEIASLLKIPNSTVRTRLFHARQELNRLFQKNL